MASNELKRGDQVTASSWDGHVETVDRIVPGPEDVAVFLSGGFWRVSQLRLVTNGKG
jgi:hypothetical protein